MPILRTKISCARHVAAVSDGQYEMGAVFHEHGQSQHLSLCRDKPDIPTGVNRPISRPCESSATDEEVKLLELDL